MEPLNIFKLIIVSLSLVVSNADEGNSKSRGNLRNNPERVPGLFTRRAAFHNGTRRQNERQTFKRKRPQENNVPAEKNVPAEEIIETIPDSVSVSPVLLKDLYRMFNIFLYKEAQENSYLKKEKIVGGETNNKNIGTEHVQQSQKGSHRFVIPGIRQPKDQQQKIIGHRKEKENVYAKVPKFTDFRNNRKSFEKSRRTFNLDDPKQQSKVKAEQGHMNQHIRSNLASRSKVNQRRGEYRKISNHTKPPFMSNIKIKLKTTHNDKRISHAQNKPFSGSVNTPDIQTTKTIRKKVKVALPEIPRISNFGNLDSARPSKGSPFIINIPNKIQFDFRNLPRSGRPIIRIDLEKEPVQLSMQHKLPVKRKIPKGKAKSIIKKVGSVEQGNLPINRRLPIEQQRIIKEHKNIGDKLPQATIGKQAENIRHNLRRLHMQKVKIEKSIEQKTEKSIEPQKPVGGQRLFTEMRKSIEPRRFSVGQRVSSEHKRHFIGTSRVTLEHKDTNKFKQHESKEDAIFKRRKSSNQSKLKVGHSESEELSQDGHKEDAIFKRRKFSDQSRLKVGHSESEKLRRDGNKEDNFFKRRKSLKQSKLPMTDGSKEIYSETKKRNKIVQKQDQFFKLRKFPEKNRLAIGQSDINEAQQDESKANIFFKSIKPLEHIKLSAVHNEAEKFLQDDIKEDRLFKRRKFSEPGGVAVGQSKIKKFRQDERKGNSFFKSRKSSEQQGLTVEQTKIKKLRQDENKDELLLSRRKSPERRRFGVSYSKATEFILGESKEDEVSKIKTSSISKNPIMAPKNHGYSGKMKLPVIEKMSAKRMKPVGQKVSIVGTRQSSENEMHSNSEVRYIINDSQNRKLSSSISSQDRSRKPELNNIIQSRGIVNVNKHKSRLTNTVDAERSRSQSGPELGVIKSQTGRRLHQAKRNKLLDKQNEGQLENTSIFLKEPIHRGRQFQKQQKIQQTSTISGQYKIRKTQVIQDLNQPEKDNIQVLPSDQFPGQVEVINLPATIGSINVPKDHQEALKLSAAAPASGQIQTRNNLKEKNIHSSLTTRNKLGVELLNGEISNERVQEENKEKKLKGEAESINNKNLNRHSQTFHFPDITNNNKARQRNFKIHRKIVDSSDNISDATIKTINIPGTISNLSRKIAPRTTLKNAKISRKNTPTATLRVIESNVFRKTTPRTTLRITEPVLSRKTTSRIKESKFSRKIAPIVIGTTDIYHLPIIKQDELPEEPLGASTYVTPYTVDIALKHAEDTWKQDPYREKSEEAEDKLFDIDYSKDPDPDYAHTEESQIVTSEVENETISRLGRQPSPELNRSIFKEKPSKQRTEDTTSRRNRNTERFQQPTTLISESRNQQVDLPGLMDQIYMLGEIGSSSYNKNRARGKGNQKENDSNISKENEVDGKESRIQRHQEIEKT